MLEWGSSARNPHSKHEYQDSTPGGDIRLASNPARYYEATLASSTRGGLCDGTSREGDAKDRISQQSKKVDGQHAKHPSVPAGRAEEL